MRLALLLISASLLAQDIIPLASEDTGARLHVNVVDQFGHPIAPHDVRFTLYRDTGNRLLPSLTPVPWRNGEKLPAGSYILKVAVTGFSPGIHHFKIGDQPLALTLAVIFDPFDQDHLSLEIKLREPAPGCSRVRIVLAHAPAHPVSLRTELLHKGSVTFTQIPSGDYIVVLLNDKGGVCRAVPSRVSANSPATSL